MGVTVRQPVHRRTQRRCSTEEVSFVVKPYVAQYLWLVTVFVILCVPTLFLFFWCVPSAVNMLFFMCAQLCVPMFFLLSDHHIFVCFFLFWRTDKLSKKKKTKTKKLHRFYTSSPRTLVPSLKRRAFLLPSTHNHDHEPQQAVTNDNHQLCTVVSTSFSDLCTFLHQQTFDIPLIIFSMHQKKRRGKHPPKILKSSCSYAAPPLCYYYLD